MGDNVKEAAQPILVQVVRTVAATALDAIMDHTGVDDRMQARQLLATELGFVSPITDGLAGTFTPISPVSGTVAVAMSEPCASPGPTPTPMPTPNEHDLRYMRRDAVEMAIRTFGIVSGDGEFSELIARADKIMQFIENGTQ